MHLSSNSRRVFSTYDFIVIIELLLGLLLYLFLAWMPLEKSLSRFGFEDTFYYLRVAQNLANGHGPTLDGIHFTNGFHPLWMLISIALVIAFPAGSALPVHLAFTLCAIFHVVTALLVYRIVKKRVSPGFAIVASFFWLFNYNVAALAMCGLETAIFGFLAAATLAFYLNHREGISAATGLGLGALLGLTTLARFDGALLGFLVAADQLFLWLTRKEKFDRLLVRSVPASTSVAVLMIPWLIWSSRVSGAFLPNSHRALKLWIGREVAGGNILRYFLSQVMRYAPEMGKIYGLMPLWPLSLLLFAGLCLLLFRRTSATLDRFPLLIFVAYPVSHVFYYAANYAPLNRYLYPAHLVFFIGLVIVIGSRFEVQKNKRLVQYTIFGMGLVIAANVIFSSVRSWKEGRGSAGTHSLHWTMYARVVPWLQDHVSPGEKLGAFNCGIYSYFSNRTVVDLDGVMNDSVIPALEQRRLISYLQEEGIDYVVDWETTLDFAFSHYGGLENYREKCTVVKIFEQPWGPYKGARLLVLHIGES